VLNHLLVFKDIVSDLQAIEVDYDDEDLCLIFLFFANFRDTLLYSHDTLTLDEVSEALHVKKKIKQMVSCEGSASNEGSEAFDPEFLTTSRLSQLSLFLAQKQCPEPMKVS
jgi:hypothetical protein